LGGLNNTGNETHRSHSFLLSQTQLRFTDVAKRAVQLQVSGHFLQISHPRLTVCLRLIWEDNFVIQKNHLHNLNEFL